MIDTRKKPTNDLVLKLHWLSEQEAPDKIRHVLMELQDASGLAICSMSVSSEQFVWAVARQLYHHLIVTLDGFSSVIYEELSDSELENRPVPLDQLVADAVSVDMLEDELDAATMLVEFRSRLLKSLEHVDKAIASLTKD